MNSLSTATVKGYDKCSRRTGTINIWLDGSLDEYHRLSIMDIVRYKRKKIQSQIQTF